MLTERSVTEWPTHRHGLGFLSTYHSRSLFFLLGDEIEQRLVQRAIAGHQTGEQRLGLIEHDRLTIEMTDRAASFFHKERTSADVSFVLGHKSERCIRFGAGNQGELVGDTPGWSRAEERIPCGPFSPLGFGSAV